MMDVGGWVVTFLCGFWGLGDWSNDLGSGLSMGLVQLRTVYSVRLNS